MTIRVRALGLSSYRLSDGAPIGWSARETQMYLHARTSETVDADYDVNWTGDGDAEYTQDAPNFWTQQLFAIEGVN